MTEEESEQTSDSGTQIIRLTQKELSTIRIKRVHYQLLYAGIFAFVLGLKIAEIRGVAVPFEMTYAIVACQVLFFIQYVGVLSALKYPVWITFLACIALVLVLFPGIVVLIVVDRRVGKLLRAFDEGTETDPID